VALNPWSNTLFRAIGCWIARKMPRTGVKPVALVLALLLVLGSLPVRAQTQRRPGRKGTSGPSGDILAAAVAKFSGKLKAVDKKEIVIASVDDQIVTFHRSRKTRFLANDKPVKPEEIPLESLVTVEASKDSVGDLVAVDIIWKNL
jgi:hypothetical protein